jgi:hypothetical protein
MFQDVAGTQPITASGQTRALHLDKSKGLVLGPELKGTGAIVASGTSTGATYDATTGVAALTRTDVSNRSDLVFTTVASRWYKFSFTNNGPATVSARSTVAGLIATVLPGASITLHQTGVTDLRIVLNGDPSTGTVTVHSIAELPGNHRYQANLASRPQYIEDETGHYGLFDGIDDFDETNAVDFTGTDKMTVWWGGRKLSDAAFGSLIEHRNWKLHNTGIFALFAPLLQGQRIRI